MKNRFPVAVRPMGKYEENDIAELVKRAMRLSQVTYSDMARKLGVTRQSVYQQLNLRDNMSVSLAADMLAVCGFRMYVAKYDTTYPEIWRVH